MNHTPLVMGILNINSDSFYSGSRVKNIYHFETKYNQMINDGADIIDIGACSTRPGSQYISAQDEWNRLSPIIKTIKNKNTTISIDTFRSEIVKKIFDIIGPFIVNDISCSTEDSQMFETVAKLNLKYIGMHKRGTPEDMQLNCDYEDIVEDIRDYFIKSINKANEAGIKEFIMDPGFGFSKNIDQNYKLLNNLSRLKIKKSDGDFYPLLVGISRKSMIYKPLNSNPENILHATSALHLYSLIMGANIIRAHDVKETKEVLIIYNKIKNNI